MHSHKPVNLKSARNILISVFLNAVIVIGELIAGVLSNSLALISDAMHNLSDLFSLILSYIAAKMKFWKATPEKSYGYRRTEIIVAFVNSTVLIIIGVYIIYEAISRIVTPEPVKGFWIIAVAGISFLANGISTLLLKQNAHEDLNTKTAYLHLFYDTLNSLIVVIAGTFIYFYNWIILDPIFSIVIGIFIIISGWNVAKDTINILSEGTPKELDSSEVTQFILSLPEVKSVHHLHIWSLSTNFYALSAHVVVDDQLISKGYLIIDRIEKSLNEKFGINHPTIQLEAELSDSKGKTLKILKNNFNN